MAVGGMSAMGRSADRRLRLLAGGQRPTAALRCADVNAGSAAGAVGRGQAANSRSRLRRILGSTTTKRSFVGGVRLGPAWTRNERVNSAFQRNWCDKANPNDRSESGPLEIFTSIKERLLTALSMPRVNDVPVRVAGMECKAGDL